MAESAQYNPGFYASQASGSSGSAGQIVPIIYDLLKPGSVLDVGCGVGTWLAEFQKNGVADVMGMDGDYVNRSQLRIDPTRFVAADLTKPISPGRTFDLAISLEVAEHLPRKAAAAFVESLTNHAPIVVFSAAIPEQGGTAHLNEQWQHYWAELFEARGYVAIDAIRRHVWSDPKVECFYAQNIVIYGRSDALEKNEKLRAEFNRTAREMLSVVHPSSWLLKSDPWEIPTSLMLKMIPTKIYRGIKFRIQYRFFPGTLPKPEYLSPSKF